MDRKGEGDPVATLRPGLCFCSPCPHGTPELGGDGSILLGPCRGSIFETRPDLFSFGDLLGIFMALLYVSHAMCFGARKGR